MKLTAARRRGLEVMAIVQHENRHKRPERQRSRVSNVTWLSADRREGSVYWQTANWLVDEGLAAVTDAGQALRLTGAGVKLAKAEGLWPR